MASVLQRLHIPRHCPMWQCDAGTGIPMSHATNTRRSPTPQSALDADAVRAAYRRWAGVYDTVFGGVSAWGRRRVVAEANRLPGTRVLEVGVGTGLALPRYLPSKRITGI